MSVAMNPRELPLVHKLPEDRRVSIKVIGVGNAGAAMVGRMELEGLERVERVIVNTDERALEASPLAGKVLVGAKKTRGLGTGGDPELGAEIAESERELLGNLSKGCSLVFVVAGLGGGTGGSLSPVVAEEAARNGAVVLGFVTTPFTFEGGRRAKQAEESLFALRKKCDAVIPLANDALLQMAASGEGIAETLARSDDWITRGVRSLWAMLFRTGPLVIDFAALRAVFQMRGGRTIYGFANAATLNGAVEALGNCPLALMPEFAKRADRLLVNIRGGGDLSLADVNGAMELLLTQFGRDVHVTVGAVTEEAREDVEVVVLGVSDLGAKARAAVAKPTPARQAAAAPKETLPGTGGGRLPTKRARGGAALVSVNQGELEFGEVDEGRGFFEKTDKNLFEGEDLDVPTFLRRGVKLAQ